MNDLYHSYLESLARLFSEKRVKEAIDSLRKEPQNWSYRGDGEVHRTKPYPMGFWPHPDPKDSSERNLYWAQGWGMSTHIIWWERYALRRAVLFAFPMTL